MASHQDLTLRTAISQWLDETDIFVKRLQGAALPDKEPEIRAALVHLRIFQFALAEFFVKRSAGTPDKYRTLLNEARNAPTSES